MFDDVTNKTQYCMELGRHLTNNIIKKQVGGSKALLTVDEVNALDINSIAKDFYDNSKVKPEGNFNESDIIIELELYINERIPVVYSKALQKE